MSRIREPNTMGVQPKLQFWQIWNMCFGFMGIQFGFALQNANVSRIFQTLGADYSNMTVLWLAAPITGLLVQPIVGYFSDRTWGLLGRRRPYFLYGAIAASLALVAMPNSAELWIAAGLLWILDASINISMEPFRAFVGDMLPPSQRGLGFAMQSFFIGVGSVVASALPWIMANWLSIESTAPNGTIPDSVRYAFYVGAFCFLMAVMWTVVTTREYSPDQLDAFERHAVTQESTLTTRSVEAPSTETYIYRGGICLAVGLILTLIVWFFLSLLDRNLLILTVGIGLFGLLQILVGFLKDRNRGDYAVAVIIDDLFCMPRAMKQLAVVQFFSWFPFFAMWSSTTSAVTSHHYKTYDTTSTVFAEGADWVGVLFATYNSAAILAAICIPLMARNLSLRSVHTINLCLGGVGLISFVLINDPHFLLISMLGIGFAWASILSVPYALLSNVLPLKKMGLYMGIFNFFIVLPQILAASILGVLVEKLFHGETIYALVIGGFSMLLAGFFTTFIDQPSPKKENIINHT